MLTKNFVFLSLSLLIFNISNCYTMEDLPKQNNNNISQNIINIENEPAPEPCNKNDININAITIYTDPIMLRDYVISNKKKIINPKELSVEEIWVMYNGLRKLLPIKPYRVIYNKSTDAYTIPSKYLIENYSALYNYKYNDNNILNLSNNLLQDYLHFLTNYSKINYIIFNIAWSIIIYYAHNYNSKKLSEQLLEIKDKFINANAMNIRGIYDMDEAFLGFIKHNVKSMSNI